MKMNKDECTEDEFIDADTEDEDRVDVFEASVLCLPCVLTDKRLKCFRRHQSINQPISQSINQPINQPDHSCITNQSKCAPVGSLSINQLF